MSPNTFAVAASLTMAAFVVLALICRLAWVRRSERPTDPAYDGVDEP